MRSLACLCLFLLAGPASATLEKGTFRVVPLGDQKDVPERYRLKEAVSTFELEKKRHLPVSGTTVHHLRFPSPVKSATPENNVVHAEYYRPPGKGPFPAVIVLDITGGNQALSRYLSTVFAQKGIAGLFVQMAYYGPRRPPGSDVRLLSANVPRTIAGVTQTVLDVRVATAWLASRPEIDPDRLGVVGTSLGSFVSALAGQVEPRLGRVVVLLGGGGLIDAYYDDPRGNVFRRAYEALGGTKDKAKQLVAPVDPLTLAANLQRKKLLMIAASRDEIVPPVMARRLWEASGKQKIVWYDTTHYGAALFVADALEHVVTHLLER